MEKIVYKIALIINKDLYEENKISYKMYKNAEKEIFKNLNKKGR